jgi:hypothetical protein
MKIYCPHSLLLCGCCEPKRSWYSNDVTNPGDHASKVPWRAVVQDIEPEGISRLIYVPSQVTEVLHQHEGGVVLVLMEDRVIRYLPQDRTARFGPVCKAGNKAVSLRRRKHRPSGQVQGVDVSSLTESGYLSRKSWRATQLSANAVLLASRSGSAVTCARSCMNCSYIARRPLTSTPTC